MRLLLDTATFIWITLDAPQLSARARSVVQEPENDVYLSAVSSWEIGVKHRLGRLRLPELPSRLIPRLRDEHGIEPLALDEEASLQLDRLPDHHRDPFDRMLICQALVGGLVILTPDEQIRRYAVRTDW